MGGGPGANLADARGWRRAARASSRQSQLGHGLRGLAGGHLLEEVAQLGVTRSGP